MNRSQVSCCNTDNPSQGGDPNICQIINSFFHAASSYAAKNFCQIKDLCLFHVKPQHVAGVHIFGYFPMVGAQDYV